MKSFSLKQRAAIAAGLALLALFMVRPGVSRLKTRITVSLSRAISRPVDIDSVHLRFLPQPGFDLENVVVYEDPAFGSEPMLRAPEVTAVFRLTALVRGRLDIARVELNDFSLNLVRRRDGRWNWEDLLQRAAQTPLAPTAKAKSEPRPGFPYIQAESGRINFKAGQEKKPWALLNADFAVWQASENSWGARLKAEPMRTDMSMNDSGLLRAEGTWKRAASLHETPLQASLELEQTQLGQLTKLISGTDKGWRGGVRIDATLSGMPASLQVVLDTSIQDFHRYDISNVEGILLAAHCEGRYSSAEAVMHEILCRAPAGEGEIVLRGEAGLPGVHRVDLALNLDKVPVSAVAALARRSKKSLPIYLVSTGTVQGDFSVKQNGQMPAEFEGRGEIMNLELQSATTNVKLAAASIPLTLSSPQPRLDDDSSGKDGRRKQPVSPESTPEEIRLDYGPFLVPLGRPAPAQVHGWISKIGYAVEVRGEGEILRTSRLAGLLGIPAAQTNADGLAQMDLQITGLWAAGEQLSAFAPPEVTGSVHLRSVHAHIRGVNGPLEISAADIHLKSDEVRMDKLSAKAADTIWTGDLELPRGCGIPGACTVRFNLNTEILDMAQLSSWLGSSQNKKHWYQLLSPETPVPGFLETVVGSGKLSAARFEIRGVAVQRASASLGFDHGKVQLSDFHGDVFGGKFLGTWHADFSSSSPTYTGAGTFTGIALQQVASAMHDDWITGTTTGTYRISASGTDAASFWQSAEGELHFDVRDAALAHISLAGDEAPLRILRWQGTGRLHSEEIEMDHTKLQAASEDYEVKGIASLRRDLNFKLTPVGDATAKPIYMITGTVTEPRVEAVPAAETQAKLKR